MSFNLPPPESYTPGWKRPRLPRFTLRFLFLCVTAACVAVGLLTYIVRINAYLARQRVQISCQNNLKQIGCALHNYHDVWNCFPASTRTNSSGKAFHSWRVAILPMLENSSVFEQYEMSEPWNGPRNSRLHGTYSPYWRCPEDRTSAYGTTSYVAITGPGTGWPAPNKSSRKSDFKDGLSNSIMVVEIRDSDIHWMEPRDLDIRTLKFAINSDGKNSISSRHLGGALVLYGDGYVVELLSDQETETRLRQMLLIADEMKAARPKEIKE